MNYLVRFGLNRTIEFPSLPSIWHPEPFGASAKCLTDVAAATRSALEQPLGLPPLCDCITEDDEVVLAIRRGTPRSAEIAGTVIQSVLGRLSPPRSVTVLRSEADARSGMADPREFLNSDYARRVVVKTHEARNPDELAYLARFQDGEELRLNRALVEADVVIPIGWTQGGGTWNRYSAFGAVFPAFADHKAQQRHWRHVVDRLRRKRKTVTEKSRRRYGAGSFSRQANWLLGMQFALQVVPGPSGTILRVLAGELQSVYRQAWQEFRQTWGLGIQQQADLVVAGVDHNPSHTVWENLAQAAWTASRLVRPGGQIILLTDWESGTGLASGWPPTPAEAASRGSWTDILQEFGDGMVPFWLLSRVRRRASVCVWSPTPVEHASWKHWTGWLGVETSSRVQVLHQWVRSAASTTLLSHATLVWPYRIERS